MATPTPAEVALYRHPEAWKDQFPGRGWAGLVFYRTPVYLHRIRVGIIEEGVDLCARDEFASWGTLGPLPGSGEPSSIADYVSKSILRPLFGRPFPSIIGALEGNQFLNSKLFVRDSGWLPAAVSAIAKIFGTKEEAPRALYAILYESLIPEQAGSDVQLRNDLQVVGAACQLLLDVAPHVQEAKPTRASMLAWHNQYLSATGGDLLDDAAPAIQYDEDKAALSELNATVLAFMCILKTGHQHFCASAPTTVPAWHNRAGLDAEFEATLSRCVKENRLPQPLKDFPFPSPDFRPDEKAPLPTGMAAWRLRKIADDLVRAGQEQPFAWLSRAIEDRFLNMTPMRNVRITYWPDAHNEDGYLIIHRSELHSVANESELKLRYPPHLISIELHYPCSWDVSQNPEHRFKLCKWLALIDLVERKRIEQTENKDNDIVRSLDDGYDPPDLLEADAYALSLDIMTGSIVHDRFTLPQTMAMLGGSCVSWAELMAIREWREAILPQIDYQNHTLPRLLSEKTPAGERPWLLSELVSELPAHKEKLTRFVLDKLCDNDLDAQHEFLEMLVYAAQELDFFDEVQRKTASSGVWRITEQLAETQDMRKPEGLWAGIRVFASLAPEPDLPRLARFLADDVSRRTQQAALRALYGHAFHVAPPRNASTAAAFQKCLQRLVNCYLRTDLISDRDTGLMARELVRTQAALGLQDTLLSLETVSKMGRPWFTKKVTKDLLEQSASFDPGRSRWTASTCHVWEDIRRRLGA